MRTRFRAASVVVVAGAVVATGLAVAGPAAAGPYRYITQPGIFANQNARQVAVDTGTHRVYTVNSDTITPANSTVSVIDTATASKIATIALTAAPDAIAVDSNSHKIYLANPDARTVTVIDGATNTVTASIPVGNFPTDVAVDPSTHTVYVANANDESLQFVDGVTNTITKTVDLAARPADIAVDPTTHVAYVITAFGTTYLKVVNSAGVVTKTVDALGYPSGVAVDTATHKVYVIDAYDSLQKYNPDGTFVEYYSVRTDCRCSSDDGNQSGSFDINIDPATGTAYIAQNRRVVVVVDLKTKTVTDRPRFAADVRGLTVDPGANYAYATTTDGYVVPIRRQSIRIQQEAPVAATVQQGQSYSGQLVSSNTVGAVTYSTTSEPGPLSVSSSGFVSAPATTPAGVYTASGKSRDAKGGYGSWTFTLTVSEPTQARADLSVSVAAPSTAVAASNVTVTVTVKNNGPNDADQLETIVSIPDGWGTSGTQGGVKDGQSLTFRAPSLPNQNSVAYTFDLVPGTAGPATVYATTGSETRDPKFSDNVSRKTVQVS